MKIGVIGAMREEIFEIKKDLINIEQISDKSNTYYLGNIQEHEVIVTQSGIGKVCAACATVALIEKYNVDCIINIGIAGGIGKDINIGDTVLATKCAYHDVDVTAFNYAKGQIPDYPLYFETDQNLLNKALAFKDQFEHVSALKQGLIISGDAFINSTAKVKALTETFNDAVALEMESCAICHACYRYDKPCLIIRTISDKADESSNSDSVNNTQTAVIAGTKLLLEVIKSI